MAVKSTIAPIHHGISRNVTEAIERLSTDPGAAAKSRREAGAKMLRGDKGVCPVLQGRSGNKR